MYFETGLNLAGWCQALTRRMSSGLSSASRSHTRLPSWPWIVWESRISSRWSSNKDYSKKGRCTRPLYAIPVTERYTRADASGVENRRISWKFLSEGDSLKDYLNCPLPRGWTLHIQDPDTVLEKWSAWAQWQILPLPSPFQLRHTPLSPRIVSRPRILVSNPNARQRCGVHHPSADAISLL